MGTIDTYIRYNLNSDQDVAPRTSFANLPGLAWGIANIVISYEGEESGDAFNSCLKLTANYTSGNMIIKPEIKIDSASEKLFTNNSDISNNLASFIIAAIYSL